MAKKLDIPERLQHVLQPDGTMRLDRALPLPNTISLQAADYLIQAAIMAAPEQATAPPLWSFRESSDANKRLIAEQMLKAYDVQLDAEEVSGVGVMRVSPRDGSGQDQDAVLINLHGGGFVMGAGSLIEAIPIAAMTRIPVVVVDYALAPETCFPVARDQVIGVYRHLLHRHPATAIGIYGTSAGGYLTAQVMHQIKNLELPPPGALGLFTCSGDMSRYGDTAALFSLSGVIGNLLPPIEAANSHWRAYAGGNRLDHPSLSPQLGDLKGWPPCLLMAGTRDVNLSATTIFHRALRAAEVDADLFVFEAMPHAHWYMFHLPEAAEALQIQARFFEKSLKGLTA